MQEVAWDSTSQEVRRGLLTPGNSRGHGVLCQILGYSCSGGGNPTLNYLEPGILFQRNIGSTTLWIKHRAQDARA